MVERTRFHLILLHIVLVVVTVRGSIPDLQDLTSSQFWNLLCPFLNAPDSWQDEEDLGDEVSGPVRSGPGLVRRIVLDPTAGPRRESADPTVRPIVSDAFPLAGPHGHFGEIDGLIHRLCRLTC